MLKPKPTAKNEVLLSMSRGKLKWMVIAMVLASVLLVGLQFYWIQQSVVANRAQFRRDVYEALETVSKKLEQQETQRVAVNKFQKFDMPDIQINIDSLEASMEQLYKGNASLKIETINLDSLANAVKQLHFDTGIFIYDSLIDKYSNSGRPRLNKTMRVDIRRQMAMADTLQQRAMRMQQKDIVRLRGQQREMVTIVMDEMWNSKPMKVQQTVLDSLLQKTFLDKGLPTDFSYALIATDKDEVIFSNGGTLPNTLKSSTFSVSLFPARLKSANQELRVIFADEQQQVLAKSIPIMLLSLMLAMGIIACFLYALNTILKQKKLSDMKADFVNNMTHEFKTPISTVSLACQALQTTDMAVEPHAMQRYIEIIRQENERLSGNVEKILQMAVLEREEIQLNCEKLSLHQLMQQTLEAYRLPVQEKAASINLALLATEDTVLGDKDHLHNVFSNLLDNALKYNTTKPDIFLKTNTHDGNIVIAFHDNGIGISPEDQKKLFDSFYRVPTGNLHEVKGFGLGLSYVKNILALHDGDITVTSKPGEGSVFTIQIPIYYEPAHSNS